MKKNNFPKRSQLLVMSIVVIALLGLLMINSKDASATNQTTAQTELTAQSKTSDSFSLYSGESSSALPSIFKVGGALAVVIIAIYLGLFILKRMMGKKYSGNKKNSVLEVLETTYIGPKKTVSLIRVAGKSVLVASTESQISMLTEMDSDETNEIMREMNVEIEPDMFQNMLNSASEKIKAMAQKNDRLKTILPLNQTQKADA